MNVRDPGWVPELQGLWSGGRFTLNVPGAPAEMVGGTTVFGAEVKLENWSCHIRAVSPTLCLQASSLVSPETLCYSGMLGSGGRCREK